MSIAASSLCGRCAVHLGEGIQLLQVARQTELQPENLLARKAVGDEGKIAISESRRTYGYRKMQQAC